MSVDLNGGVARERFVALLDEAAERSRTIEFWWRDDDAEDATPPLEQLLALAKHHELPLALAVIPKGATRALAERLAPEPRVAVLQHGWQHKNHAAEGEKKIELGGKRPPSDVFDELRRGRDRLRALFPHSLPVLVPPWNRIAENVCAALDEVGLSGLSTFGPAPAGAAHQVNTHLDIFAWHPTRRPLHRAEAYATLSTELARRLEGSDEPIGILTHHRVHEAESWALLDDLFLTIARHPAVRWPKIKALFDL